MITLASIATEKRCCGPATCGETRGSARVEQAGGAPVMSIPLRYCLAGQCMGWIWIDTSTSIPPERRGYCGLTVAPGES